MTVSVTARQQLTELELMAHLFRRAGFGATRDELDAALSKGYEATVEELLHPERQPEVELEEFTDIIGRNFRQPEEGLGFDNSPVAHMWRAMIRPAKYL